MKVAIPVSHTWGGQDPQSWLWGSMGHWIQSFPAGIVRTPAT